MPFLELVGLTKEYEGQCAVKNLNLAIGKGEFLALLGPSGCGKTTTLQMIAGFVAPSQGQIVLEGKDLTGVPASRRGLGLMFQSYALFPHLTVAQNVAFGLEMRRLPREEIKQQVAEALDLVKLPQLASRYPKELSGGQRQRVALARAMVIRPPLLLLDEPLGALDAKLRQDMQIELRALQHRLGVTTIMVTHDQEEAMTLADRVVVMRAGEVEQLGPPLELYERPATRFVSTFLGKINLLAGRHRGEGVVEVGAAKLPAPADAPLGEVDYLLRPEKVRLVDASTGVLSGSVESRVFVGDHWLLLVRCAPASLLLRVNNTGAAIPGEGDLVGLSWDAADARVLGATGD